MAPGAGGDGACSAPAASTSAAAATTSGPRAGDAGGLAASAAKKGPWTAAEDAILMEHVRRHGEGNWNAVQRNCELSRCGKSCRLRWANHLRPNLKKGPFSPAEERLILQLHSKLGNKWAHMAAQLPGRTDNEIKNYWNTRTKRRQRAGLPLYPPDIGRHHAASLGRQRPPTVALDAPSLADHRALYSTSVGAAPLSLLNFVTSPPPPVASPIFLDLCQHPPAFLLSTSQRPLNRLRGGDGDGDAGSFSLPFDAANPVTPLPLSSQELFAFNPLAGYDLGPPPPPAQRQARHHPPGFSVKAELPSSQLFPEPCRPTNVPVSPQLGSSNGGLLDALLGDTHAVLGGKGGVDGCGLFPGGCSLECGERELAPGLVLGIVGRKWDDLDHSTDVVPEREAAEDGGGSVIEDDLLALLDLIPATTTCSALAPTAAFGEWSNCDSGETSHEQPSGLTNDDGGREMQQHPFMVAAEDLNWSIGSCHWNDLPRSH